MFSVIVAIQGMEVNNGKTSRLFVPGEVNSIKLESLALQSVLALCLHHGLYEHPIWCHYHHTHGNCLWNTCRCSIPGEGLVHPPGSPGLSCALSVLIGASLRTQA